MQGSKKQVEPVTLVADSDAMWGQKGPHHSGEFAPNLGLGAPALVCALFQDEHSDAAWRVGCKEGLHSLSPLAIAEMHAVIARFQREEMLAGMLVQAARDAFTSSTGRFLYA